METPILTPNTPLVIKENNWEMNPQELRDKVLKPAHDLLVNAFGKNPDEPIHVYRRGDGPKVLDDIVEVQSP